MKIVRGSDLSFVPASHEDKLNPGVLKKVILRRDDIPKGRIQMINWSRLPKGKSFKPHYHEDLIETFIILNGKARITVSSEEAELGQGDSVIIPAMAVHAMTNISDTDMEYIAIGVATGEGGKTVTV